jgi:GH35 family endo-1,4-beta-xylanase
MIFDIRCRNEIRNIIKELIELGIKIDTIAIGDKVIVKLDTTYESSLSTAEKIEIYNKIKSVLEKYREGDNA